MRRLCVCVALRSSGIAGTRPNSGLARSCAAPRGRRRRSSPAAPAADRDRLVAAIRSWRMRSATLPSPSGFNPVHLRLDPPTTSRRPVASISRTQRRGDVCASAAAHRLPGVNAATSKNRSAGPALCAPAGSRWPRALRLRREAAIQRSLFGAGEILGPGRKLGNNEDPVGSNPRRGHRSRQPDGAVHPAHDASRAGRVAPAAGASRPRRAR